MLRLQHEVEGAKTGLSQLQKEREELQMKTKLLRSNGLDPDLLEEKSRELLNYSKPNEIVIIEHDEKSADGKAGVVQRNK